MDSAWLFWFFARARAVSGRQARPVQRGSQSLDSVVGGTAGHYPASVGGYRAPQQYDFTQAETHVFLNRTAHDFRVGPARGGGIEGHRPVRRPKGFLCVQSVLRSMACIVTGVSKTDWSWTAVSYGFPFSPPSQVGGAHGVRSRSGGLATQGTARATKPGGPGRRVALDDQSVTYRHMCLRQMRRVKSASRGSKWTSGAGGAASGVGLEDQWFEFQKSAHRLSKKTAPRHTFHFFTLIL